MVELSFLNFLKAGLAGLLGTLPMTGVMYLMSLTLHEQMKVPKILGTMLTGQTRPGGGTSDSLLAIITGEIAHYSVGVAFGFSYLILWHFNIGRPDAFYGAIFGFLSGILGILGWRVFIFLHPNPPQIPLKNYLFTLILAHIVFGIATFLAFNILQHM